MLWSPVSCAVSLADLWCVWSELKLRLLPQTVVGKRIFSFPFVLPQKETKQIKEYLRNECKLETTPRPCFTPECVYSFFALTPICQSTPLFNLRSLIFCLTLHLADCFLLRQPLISDGDTIFVLRLFLF